MCGIFGIVGPNSSAYRADLQGSISLLHHRGPDDFGVYEVDQCIMAHTRLALLDLENGRQPMVSTCRRYAVTFNGEIYNYMELRQKLSPHYRFTTKSDTEVLLALYMVKKSAMTDDLVGMFSFSIWDNEERTLFAARDRFGEKPYYYTTLPDKTYLFSSEIRSLIINDTFKKDLSRESLAKYLKTLYIPSDSSIYRSIQQLPPAHSLTLKNGIIFVKRYWNYPEINHSITLSQVIEKSDYLLKQAVTRCMTSDFPVGAFLSGGIDSTTIVENALKVNPNLLTMGMTVEESQDSVLTEYAAKINGNTHKQINLPSVDLYDLLTELVEVYDEPFADSSGILTSYICKYARKHVKAVLTGDGGDELYGGYSFWYKPLLKFELEQRNKGIFTDQIPVLRKHLNQTSIFSDSQISQMGFEFSECENIDDPSSLDDVLRHDLANYLPGDILKKVDMASMHHGLETRAPFLDLELAEYMISVPWNLKFNLEVDKIPLRSKLLAKYPQIATRGKQGFGAPVHLWLNTIQGKSLIGDFVLSSQAPIRGLIDLGNLDSKINPLQLWSFLVLSFWYHKYSST